MEIRFNNDFLAIPGMFRCHAPEEEGVNMRIAVGMDLHAKTAVCYAVFAGGGDPTKKETEFLDSFNKNYRSVKSDPDGLISVAKALTKHESHILIENSTKTFEAYWILTNYGCRVTVAVAQDLYRITKSLKKTDKNDSAELAKYMRRRLYGENEFSECMMPSKDWMMNRELCRTIFYEKLHLADIKRRARMHLMLQGIYLSREYADIFCRKAVEEMKLTKDPCLLILINEAGSIKKRTDFESKLIQDRFENNEDYQLLLTVPGIGSVSAAYLISLIVDIERFGSRSAFCAYFGIVPKVRESADHSLNCCTTHRGDEDARRILCQCAMVHIRVCDSVVTEMYNRLRSNGKCHKEALVAAARKLTTVIWSVLKNKTEFSTDAGLLARAGEMEDAVMEELSE